jgi:hypothetical protein
VTAPAVVLAAQQTRAPQRTIAHDASSDEQPAAHDTAEAQQHDGGDATGQATRARTDGSDGEVSVPLTQQPVQQETSDSPEEAGVSVQAELQPPTTTTDSHDGGGVDGIDGSSGGGD